MLILIFQRPNDHTEIFDIYTHMCVNVLDETPEGLRE